MVPEPQDFETILDQCLARLLAGEDLERCLADYPEQAESLRPLLALAVGLQALPTPLARSQAVEAGRDRMLAAVEQMAPARQAGRGRAPWWPIRPMRLSLGTALALLLVIVVTGLLVSNAAAESLPGDVLYPIKRAGEIVYLSLTFDAEARQQLEDEIAQERLAEIRRLSELGREATITFDGRLLAIDGDRWRIGELVVLVEEQTRLDEGITLGQILTVQAHLEESGALRALHIRIRSGRPEEPALGPSQTPRLKQTARPVESVQPRQTARPGVTPTPGQPPQATQTPAPTQTPRRTAAPSATPQQTAKPTNTPQKQQTTKPTNTPQKQQTARPTNTPQQQQTARPSNTPQQQQTAAPQQTPQPGSTPNQQQTAAPSQTPQQQQTPPPNRTPGGHE